LVVASRCARRLPGFAVEHHGEVFFRWRDAIDQGGLEPGFHVTHNRDSPRTGDDGLGDGNYLAFTIANRWVNDVTYVTADADDDDASVSADGSAG
jgi:hypothetical protein